MTGSISRRSVLALLGSGIAIPSGCLSFPGSSKAPDVSELAVQNKHDEPHTFDVQAMVDESVRKKWGYEAPAGTYRDGKLQEPTGKVWTDPLDSTKGVMLRARIDGGAWESYLLAAYSGECLRVEAEVETDGYFQLETAACD